MKKILFTLFVFVFVLSACAVAPSADPAVAQPQTKCDWLRENFPQTTEGIQALGAQLAGVPLERIATHGFRCTPESMVFDGFIVLGPGEGDWTSSFNLPVPSNGAVDAYKSATCTGESKYIGPETDTLRCFDGTVNAVRATYWPWLDENPPVSGGTSSQAVAGAACIDPTALAAQHGWTFSASPDNYGGLVVTLSSADTLPADWEANGPTGSIKEFDTNRSMSPSTYTVYPPYSCRAELGYSQ